MSLLLILFLTIWPACNSDTETDTSSAQVGDSGALISALKEGDADQRLEAAKALHRYPGSETVTALIGALQDDDPRVRETAAVALGRLRDPLAVDALIDLLSDEEEDVALSAAAALGLIGHPAAVEPLSALLENNSSSLAENAITALGNIDTPEAADALLRTAGNSSPERLSLIKESLTFMGKPAGDRILAALANEDGNVANLAADALLAMGYDGIEFLLKGLDGDSLDLRRRTARALGRSGNIMVIKPLIRAFGDRELHAEAVNAIVEFGEKADDDLIDALLADNSLIRKGAAEALGRLGISRAMPYLFELRNDADQEVRMAAQEAINRIDESR